MTQSTSNDSISGLLDAHLAALQATSSIEEPARPGPAAEAVSGRLREAGYGDRPEIVEFLTWADYSPPNQQPAMFWELPVHLDLDAAIAIGEKNRSLIDPTADISAYPGPEHWLPLLMLDGSEYLAVDTSTGPDGGSVWFCYTEIPNFKMFPSLAEAIKAATYCVVQGLWTYDATNNTVHAERNDMPNPGDLS